MPAACPLFAASLIESHIRDIHARLERSWSMWAVVGHIELSDLGCLSVQCTAQAQADNITSTSPASLAHCRF